MLDRLRATLSRLRKSLTNRAEDAYKDRDAADTPIEQAYAEGEARAYGVASDEVRAAEKADE